jgi:two-component system chemotaxis response regulator CheB
MDALPRDLAPGTGRRLTGVTCPDCPGSLTVEVQGHKGHLHFVCRVGHAYSVAGLLAAKEEVLEDRLWGAALALEELAALLGDLEAYAVRQCWAGVETLCRTRRQLLEEHALALRRLIEQDRPVEIGFDDPGTEMAQTGPPGS